MMENTVSLFFLTLEKLKIFRGVSTKIVGF